MPQPGSSQPQASPQAHSQPSSREHTPLQPQQQPQPRAEPPLVRRLSEHSEVMLDRLLTFERDFEEITAMTAAIAEAFRCGAVPPGKARDDLAQLEARLDRIQCEGIDSVDTYELRSGREQARALRKSLTRRAEEMHGSMEKLFLELRDAVPKR